MLGFKLLELLEEAVVFAVGDFRLSEYVIEVIVPADRLSQLLDLSFGVATHGFGSDAGAAVRAES